MRSKRLKPKQFLILLIFFALASVFLSQKVIVNAYNIAFNTAQIDEILIPKVREETKAVESSNTVCGTPVVVYEDTQNCSGGGSVDVDFSESNGGRKQGTVVYSKDLSLKISKITIPLNILSGSDIPSTNIEITKGNKYILPSASSMFVDAHENVGRIPGEEKVSVVEYETWATTGEVLFSEVEESSQKSQVVVDEYVLSNTKECAICSTNSDKSEKIGGLVNSRSLSPGHSNDIESKVPILMCKDEDSIEVDAKGVGCIDEEFSILKRVTAIFSGSDWEKCNEVEYDEEGNIISDGRCIDIENVVLDLSGIFENTNMAYEKIVDDHTAPGSEYTCEMAVTFPAWVEIDGKGIYKISAKINVPYECWRKNQEFDDTDSETPSSVKITEFVRYLEGLNMGAIKF